MAHKKNQQPASNTAPKGRPTAPRSDNGPVRRDTVTLQWTALGVAIVGIIGGLIYFGGDWGDGTINHGGGGQGAPAVVVDAPLVGRPGQVG